MAETSRNRCSRRIQTLDDLVRVLVAAGWGSLTMPEGEEHLDSDRDIPPVSSSCTIRNRHTADPVGLVVTRHDDAGAAHPAADMDIPLGSAEALRRTVDRSHIAGQAHFEAEGDRMTGSRRTADRECCLDTGKTAADDPFLAVGWRIGNPADSIGLALAVDADRMVADHRTIADLDRRTETAALQR